MVQLGEASSVRIGTNAATAGAEGTGWWARWRQGWQEFLAALLQAMSAWAS
jgi:hypothetical protein